MPTVTTVKGVASANPSTYTCATDTPAIVAKVCANWRPFWSKPPALCGSPAALPGYPCYTYNGTAVVNGVTCNQFDWGSPGSPFADSKFYSTPTTPCRATHPSQREDYNSFDATTPPISAFDGPAWFKTLTQCKPVDVASAMPKPDPPF